MELDYTFFDYHQFLEVDKKSIEIRIERKIICRQIEFKNTPLKQQINLE